MTIQIGIDDLVWIGFVIWNDPIGERLAETITTLFCLLIVI